MLVILFCRVGKLLLNYQFRILLFCVLFLVPKFMRTTIVLQMSEHFSLKHHNLLVIEFLDPNKHCHNLETGSSFRKFHARLKVTYCVSVCRA